MAVRLTQAPSRFNEYPRSISRQGAYPLERESLFFSLGEINDTGVTTARGYAKNSPLAYVGQTISVVDVENSVVQFFQIVDTAGTLKNVGADLIDVGDAEDTSKGATIAWIKDYVEDYVANNGGGGTYVPAALTFSGLSSQYVEIGTAYSLTDFLLNINTPNAITSAISIEQGLYSYTIPQSDIIASNQIAVSAFTNTGGRSLAISGSATEGTTSFAFNASCTDRSGTLTAAGTFSRTGCYYAYFGTSGSTSITPETIASDGFIANVTGGRQLCSSNTFNLSLTTQAGNYIWICIPATKTLVSIFQNGYDVTDAFASNLNQSSGVRSHTDLCVTDYKCYRSNAQAVASMSLVVTIS